MRKRGVQPGPLLALPGAYQRDNDELRKKSAVIPIIALIIHAALAPQNVLVLKDVLAVVDIEYRVPFLTGPIPVRHHDPHDEAMHNPAVIIASMG